MEADQARRHLKYWIACLKDADVPTIRLEGEAFFDLSPAHLKKGIVPFETADQILDEVNRDRAGSPTKDEHSTRVIISPLVLKPTSDHGAAQVDCADWIAPFWIPATLSLAEPGEPADLLPVAPREGQPWVSREFLSPRIPPKPTVGSLKAMDEFLTGHGEFRESSWEEYFEDATKLFKATAGIDIDDDEAKLGRMVVDGYTLFLESKLLIGKIARGVGKPIRTLYEQMLGQEALTRLVQSLGSKGVAESFELKAELAKLPPYLGHPVAEFPLADAQRAVVLAGTALKWGEILAVNGPPGTGKTTLLQSLVASFWVDRALKGKQPPVILACSTNNQAVLNILRAFAIESDDNDAIARRWIPEPASGYGMSLPSKSKKGKGEAARYPWAWFQRSNFEGQPVELEKEEYCQTAVSSFVEAGRRCFSNLSEPSEDAEQLDWVKEITDRLRETLSEEKEELDSFRNEAFELAETRKVWQERGFKTSTEAASFYVGELALAGKRLEENRSFNGEVQHQLAKISIWLELLAPFIRSKRKVRDDNLAEPFEKAGVVPPALPARGYRAVLAEFLQSRHQTFVDAVSQASEEMKRANSWAAVEAQWRKRIERALAALPERHKALSVDELCEDPTSIDRLLDVTSRYRLFHLAARYWEGRWILEMDQSLENKAQLTGQSELNARTRFRRYAKLTPLLVATFHRAPDAFSYFRGTSQPLLDFVDLLIVDEAGQVLPEIGAATFGLAKRAVVVGDVAQIEPVRSLAPGSDHSNLEYCGLDIEPQAFTSSSGTLMGMAQHGSRFSLPGRQDGLWLEEHRRCVPKIIRYCNELVYEGLLVPKRPPIEDSKRLLPPLGWGHIRSTAGRVGGSWVNPGEADIIVDWLRVQAKDLEKRYKRPLAEIVGIISPYKAQAVRIDQALVTAGLKTAGDAEGIGVGTVHTFQGGERPVILFSAAVNYAEGRGFMMNIGPNLLNVAVSRAKDSFVVFGDMRVFDPQQNTPSGKLARLLFEDPGNEITDLKARAEFLRVPTDRIDNLEDHRRLLKLALEKSGKRVLIVSPLLSRWAVEADDVLGLVQSASDREVEVVIAFSADFHRNSKLAEARRVAETLRKAGATVHELNRFHNKTLVCDETFLVEGSFNWLAAVRARGHKYQRHEVSLQCGRPDCLPMVTRAWDEIDQAVARDRRSL